MSKPHEAIVAADFIEHSVACGGTEWNRKTLEAAAILRRQHALIVQMVEHADPDATECDECAGAGWYWKECQVAERVTDVQSFKTDCEACAGVGFIGPDAEFKRALTAATDYLKGPQ
jgi:hypothetical protein